MTFHEKFEKGKVKVWEDFYLNYPVMLKILEPFKNQYKKKLDKAVYKTRNSIMLSQQSVDTNSLLANYYIPDEDFDFSKMDDTYTEQFKEEIKKINHFYIETFYGRIKQRYNNINDQIHHADLINEFEIYEDTFEMAIKEVYKEVCLLEDFIDLNLQAKDKLLKKYEKYFKYFFDSEEEENKVPQLRKIINDFIETNTELSTSKENLRELKDNISKLFGHYFSGKYKKRTHKILKSYLTNTKLTESESFYLGFFIGLLFFILAFIIFLAYNYQIDMDVDQDFKSLFPMFRGFFIICLYWWILGFNVYFWNKSNISYKVIFKFDNHFSTVIEICKRAAFFTFLLFACVLIYIIQRANLPVLTKLFLSIPSHILPLICWGTFILYIYFPFESVFNYEGRTYLHQLFSESIGSFLLKTDFRHVWFIDQMTTFISTIRDMEYTLCFYAYYDAPLYAKIEHCSKTRGIYLFIAFFPNMLRIFQCLKQIIDTKKTYPQNLNIIKYSLNIIVACLSFFWPTFPFLHPVWFIFTFISSCYSFVWDIKMDFGLMQKGKNYPLRDKLYYKKKWVYYLISILDFFLRFLWLITLSPEVINEFIRPESLSLILGSLEIFRRGMWNLIRVEYKHFEISKEFKVTNDVELPFIKQGMKFVNNENNLLGIMGMNREQKIQYELEKIMEEKERRGSVRYESRFIPDTEPITNNNINDDLNEYLKAYDINTRQNMNLPIEGTYKKVLSRKI
jgi:hypothetical protein